MQTHAASLVVLELQELHKTNKRGLQAAAPVSAGDDDDLAAACGRRSFQAVLHGSLRRVHQNPPLQRNWMVFLASASVARRVALDPSALEAAREQVRLRYFAKHDEAIFETGAARRIGLLGRHRYDLPSEGAHLTHSRRSRHRSTDSEMGELRLGHLEPNFAVSPALDRALKKVIDAVT